MLGGQLKPPAEGEEETRIPLHKLQHPAHQVLSGTFAVKSLIGQLRRPQVGQHWRPEEKMDLPVLPRLALSVPPRH